MDERLEKASKHFKNISNSSFFSSCKEPLVVFLSVIIVRHASHSGSQLVVQRVIVDDSGLYWMIVGHAGHGWSQWMIVAIACQTIISMSIIFQVENSTGYLSRQKCVELRLYPPPPFLIESLNDRYNLVLVQDMSSDVHASHLDDAEL